MEPAGVHYGASNRYQRLGPMSVELLLRSPAATRTLGQRLGAALEAGDFVALTGDLGAGKTLLVRGAGCNGSRAWPDFGRRCADEGEGRETAQFLASEQG